MLHVAVETEVEAETIVTQPEATRRPSPARDGAISHPTATKTTTDNIRHPRRGAGETTLGIEIGRGNGIGSVVTQETTSLTVFCSIRGALCIREKRRTVAHIRNASTALHRALPCRGSGRGARAPLETTPKPRSHGGLGVPNVLTAIIL